MTSFRILLEDGPVLVVWKPAGLLTLGAIPGVPTLEREVKEFLKNRYQKPGNVYLGIPHRLDRPVSGIVLFTRNSKTAARMAEQFRDRVVRKVYRGLLSRPLTGSTNPNEPRTLEHWIRKVPDQARVEIFEQQVEDSKQARLSFRVLGTNEAFGLQEVEIELETGRMHQIRAQFSAIGSPIAGDLLYGAPERWEPTIQGLPPIGENESPLDTIALHARELEFLHPIRYDRVRVESPASWELPSIENLSNQD